MISIGYLTILGAMLIGMSAVVLRARQMSLALLVIAVVDHGSLRPFSTPQKAYRKSMAT